MFLYSFLESSFMWGLTSLESNENIQMVRAAGALVSFMQNNRLLFGELDGDQVLNSITKIVHLPL